MKKLILLLFIPLVSFSQGTEIDGSYINPPTSDFKLVRHLIFEMDPTVDYWWWKNGSEDITIKTHRDIPNQINKEVCLSESRRKNGYKILDFDSQKYNGQNIEVCYIQTPNNSIIAETIITRKNKNFLISIKSKDENQATYNLAYLATQLIAKQFGKSQSVNGINISLPNDEFKKSDEMEFAWVKENESIIIQFIKGDATSDLQKKNCKDPQNKDFSFLEFRNTKIEGKDVDVCLLKTNNGNNVMASTLFYVNGFSYAVVVGTDNTQKANYFLYFMAEQIISGSLKDISSEEIKNNEILRLDKSGIFNSINPPNESFIKEISENEELNFNGSYPSEIISINATDISKVRAKQNDIINFDKLINQNMQEKVRLNCSNPVVGTEYLKSEIDYDIKANLNKEILFCYKRSIIGPEIYLIQVQFYSGNFGYTITASSNKMDVATSNLRNIIRQILVL